MRSRGEQPLLHEPVLHNFVHRPRSLVACCGLGIEPALIKHGLVRLLVAVKVPLAVPPRAILYERGEQPRPNVFCERVHAGLEDGDRYEHYGPEIRDEEKN